MPSNPDPQLAAVLKELRQELSKVLGDSLYRVILYGSRARGMARPDSDVDVLIVVTGPFNYMDLIQRTSAIVARLSLQYDIVLSRAFASREQFEHDQAPFLRNVRREGLAV